MEKRRSANTNVNGKNTDKRTREGKIIESLKRWDDKNLVKPKEIDSKIYER